MIEALFVEGYKGLRNVVMEDLAQVNIIVGQSSAGKTALLESIRIALNGNPSAMWGTASQRGAFTYLPPSTSGEQFEAAWRQFFSDFNSDNMIRFWTKLSDGRNGIVSALFDRETSISWSTPSSPGAPANASVYNPLVFDRVSFDGINSRLSASLSSQQGMHTEQGAELGLPSEFIGSSTGSSSFLIADWFSALSIEDREHDIVKTVCSTFSNVTGLSVQSPNGIAQLYATLNTINRKLPVTAISSGITKFITILLAMNIRRGGVILIDEIENAIYYKMFPLLWRTIIDFAIETNTQLFISTHSWECLSAAAKEFEDIPSILSLLQVTNDDGATNVTVVSGDDAVNAVEGDIEVRR